jgi:hypothetical protein
MIARIFAGSLLVFAVAGCAERSEGRAPECVSLCEELVGNCGFDAYPSVDSCLQGCAWNLDQGVDVDAQDQCVSDAECDTFAIIECEHAAAATSEP